MVLANSVCRELRLPSGFFDSWSERMRRLFSGVRSSCDMLARNSDLYFEVSASCAAFSSRACRASSTSRFFRSTSAFWWARSWAFSWSSWLVCPSSEASDCDWASSASVRMFASIVLMTIPILSTSRSRKALCVGLKRSNDASSITPLTSPSNSTGRMIRLAGVAPPSPELIRT